MNCSNQFEKRKKINFKKVQIALTIKFSPNFERKNCYIYKRMHIPLINEEHFSNLKKEPM